MATRKGLVHIYVYIYIHIHMYILDLLVATLQGPGAQT